MTLTLSSTQVVIAKHECFDESMGAFVTATIFDTLTKELSGEGSMYDSLELSDFTNVPYASEEQRKEAAEVYRLQRLDIGRRAWNGNMPTYIGCTVKLARSRKAPNKVELDVVNYKAKEWDNYYGRFNPEQVCVIVPEVGEVWVSVGCVNEVVKGKAPYWA